MHVEEDPCLPSSLLCCRRVEQFKLHKQVYEGRTSRLFLATDRQSGVPVALKLYRKRKLTELNRCEGRFFQQLHSAASSRASVC